MPGVRALAAPGHTPGHIALELSSGGERLLDLVDAVIHPIMMEHPDWYTIFDLRREQAAATRRRLLNRAADEGMLVIGYHFPFPGLGRVRKQAQGWEWHPITMDRAV